MFAPLALFACSEPPPEPCNSAVAHHYDPASAELTAWPDDVFTVADASSPTGRSVRLADAAWVSSLEGLLATLPGQLDGMSGFGTLSEVVLRFDDGIDPPPSPAESTTDPGLALLDLSTDPPTRVAYLGRTMDSGRQLMLLPARPLRKGAEHAVVMTTAYRSARRCIARAPLVVQDLDAGLHDDLLEALDVSATEVSAIVRFTTHDGQTPVIEAAEQARSAEQSWVAAPLCEERDGYRVCETTFEPVDFRDASGRMTATPQGRHIVPVTVWLPDTPVQGVVMVGHGLGSRRDNGTAARMARRMTALGLAAVSVDALQHGDHPTASLDGAATALPFLGLDLASASFDGRVMRSHFDQSALERLQLFSLVQAEPDLDGDGVDDFDPDRLGYIGISLGGLMGAGVLALSPDVEIAALPISGGNLASITRDTEVMAAVLPLLANLAGSTATFELYLSMIQSIVDPADPALWSTHILEDRIVGDVAPHVLLPVAMQDEVVPPAAGRALARALKLPHLEPVVEPVDLLPTEAMPAVANHPSGATVGYFQYDVVSDDGVEEVAVHDNLPDSDEAVEQIVHFMATWLEGQPEIIDPY